MAPTENERINISLDPEIAKQLRRAALEKYGNSRSLSTFIEDMFKGQDKPIEENEIDIEGIKAARKKYAAKYNETMDQLFFNVGDYRSACGSGAFRSYRCKTCDAEFETMVTDAKSCPSCHQSVLEMISLDDVLKMLSVRIRDDAFGSNANERLSKKVLNYILDELKAGHDPLPLSDVTAKFNTTPKILEKILSPLKIKAQQEKKGGRRYFTQDTISEIENILSRPWGYDFSWLRKKVEDDGKPEETED
jgi:hypothetical protein